MHQPAVSHGREHERKREIKPQNARAQTAFRDHDRVPGPEGDVLKYATVFPEGDFPLRTAVEVVEYRLRHAAACQGTKVFDAYNVR